jgi:hypothetical protein
MRWKRLWCGNQIVCRKLAEHGLLEFKMNRVRGYGVTTNDQLQEGIHAPGINQHTLETISKQLPVRAVKLAQCLKVLGESESTSGVTSECLIIF